ncbi:F-box/kelch-repeat protein [Cardamine amara subsp. amara]|uniref:F-box/kelch-repeat protein n=1 Tax=Cardamine amara subsp. amara TaxID=228776 RepID=A0ABD1AK56_CARAN
MMPGWSQLPEELLHLISTHLENCFDVVHARSVCSSWRSSFPLPSSLLCESYSLPAFADFPHEREGLCTLKKVPLFLFRVRAPPTATAAEFLMGGIGRDESEDHMELLSPLQCSVKVKIPGSDPTLINMLDCQILPLGHQYRIIGCNPKDYSSVAFLSLGEGGFVVLLKYDINLLVLTSAEMRWKRLHIVPSSLCWSLVTFRGRFYATLLSREIVVIDPYSLEVTLLLPSPKNYLVPSGNDELFLVQLTTPIGVLGIGHLTCRVSRLDEEVGKCVEVTDLGDRVLFIGGQLGTFSCSAHACGLTGNSILFINLPHDATYLYKYTGNAEDHLNCWRSSRETPQMKLETSFPVIALRAQR